MEIITCAHNNIGMQDDRLVARQTECVVKEKPIPFDRRKVERRYCSEEVDVLKPTVGLNKTLSGWLGKTRVKALMIGNNKNPHTNKTV